MDKQEAGNRRWWVYGTIALCVLVMAVLYVFCGPDVKAAEPCDCPERRAAEQKAQVAQLELAKAKAAVREAEAKAEAAQPKRDPMDGFSIPLTLGYLAGNPLFGAGLDYTWEESGISLGAQLIAARIDGGAEEFRTGLYCAPVLTLTPQERSETGFMVTARFPF